MHLTGGEQILVRRREERVGDERHRVDPAIEGDEFHPLPYRDLEDEWQHVLLVPSTAELDDLGVLGQPKGRLRERFVRPIGLDLGLDPTARQNHQAQRRETEQPTHSLPFRRRRRTANEARAPLRTWDTERASYRCRRRDRS